MNLIYYDLDITRQAKNAPKPNAKISASSAAKMSEIC